MTGKLYLLLLVLLTGLAIGCSQSNNAAAPDSNANANMAAENATKPGPDNSEITTRTDANGVKTEERVFHNNPRISRVVVTTRNGQRTVKAYSPSGEERELNKNETEDVLEATGTKIADAAGFVADKSEDVAGEAKDIGGAAKDKTQAIGEKTADTAKTVGEKSAEGAKTVANKSVDTAKTVEHKTVSGAKKAARAVKKIVP